MKRITVSLPDELVEKVRHTAGSERTISSYVAAALKDYTERETLAQVIAAWDAETPVPADVHQRVLAELDRVGFANPPSQDDPVAE